MDYTQSILDYWGKNPVSTTEVADALGKSGVFPKVQSVNHNQYRIDSVRCVFTANQSNYWVHEQIVASVARLGVSSLYRILLHRPAQLLGSQGGKIYPSLQELKEKGLVRKIGVSIYNPPDLEEISNTFYFDLIQAPFNLVDRRLQKTGWLKKLKDKGIEVHTRSAFLQGLLLMSPKIVPDKFALWSDLWKHWHSWLAEHKSVRLW